ncbi:MAG: hypothetical protein KDA55_12100, partial [Planctomycetales bacterium]|nr:hypothetical protein [Planctomycetales bacterium]
SRRPADANRSSPTAVSKPRLNIMVEISFELGEHHFLSGQYSWRIKDLELRYRGDGEFAELIIGRIPASEEQVSHFIAAIDLLDVWRWRDDYDPNDVGMMVDDGANWWFKAKLGNRECKCGGCNAFPSYADVRDTSLNGERFALLRAALYDVFLIEGYIHQARIYAEREREKATNNPVNGSRR